MNYYVEIDLHVYEHGHQTTGCGPFRSYAKAKSVAAKLDARLHRGALKAALDAAYGELEYSVIALALQLYTPAAALSEVAGA